MINLYYIQDLAGNYFPFALNILCAISILFSISVITVKNPVISILFLIGLFITIGGYLIVIGIEFIGLSYLLVYVGAVSILFLFILMLINIRVSELINETKNSIPLVFLITLIFGNISFTLLPQENTLQQGFFSWDTISSTFINTLNNWDSYLVVFTHITSIGNVMYSVYSVWLILVSIILLLAMVGAIVINIKQKTLEINKKYYSSLPKDTIILQSKINFSLFKSKLIRIFVVASIIWCIRFLLIKTIGFDCSVYLEFMLLASIVGCIDFFLKLFIFGDNLLQCASDSDQNWPETIANDNLEGSNNDSSSNPNPEIVERLKTEYLTAKEELDHLRNNETSDSEIDSLRAKSGVLKTLVMKENELSSLGESEKNWVAETKGENNFMKQWSDTVCELSSRVTDRILSQETYDSESESESSNDENPETRDPDIWCPETDPERDP